jgi:hypothetical protein
MVEGLQDKGGLDPTDDDDQGDQDDEGKDDDEHDDLDDFQDSMETDKKDSSGNKQLSSKRSHQSVCIQCRLMCSYLKRTDLLYD